MKIVVLTTEAKSYIADELTKSAEAAGHELQVIDTDKTILVEQPTTVDVESGDVEQRSKVMLVTIADDKEPELTELDPECIVIPRLNENNLEYKLNLLQQLELHGAKLLNSACSMELCNNKLSSQVVLNNGGIVTPWSMVLGSADMLDASIKLAEEADHLKFPMIIKTLRGTHGIGVMKVDSKSSLKSVAQALLARNIPLMMQEFIEHEASYRIIMIGQELLAANKRGQPESKDEFRTNSHLQSVTEKHEPSEAELEMCRKVVGLFGCNFCAVDYIMVDDKLLVLEVNGSPGLEAIQKDWPDRNLTDIVLKHCETLGNETGKSGTEATSAAEPNVSSVEEPEESKPVQPMLNTVEHIIVHRITNGEVEARVDTGAKYCSLHAIESKEHEGWLTFKYGEATYKVPVDRYIHVLNSHGRSERPIIKLDVSIKGQRFNQVEFTIADRGTMKYPVLIGRNLLEQLGFPVAFEEPVSNVTSDESEVEEV